MPDRLPERHTIEERLDGVVYWCVVVITSAAGVAFIVTGDRLLVALGGVLIGGQLMRLVIKRSARDD